MARFYLWLVGRDYWLVYFAVYAGVMVGLAIWQRPNSLETWSNVVTVSIGIASGSAIVLEVLGVLLIKPVVEKLLKQGEQRLFDRLEQAQVFATPAQRQEAERILRQSERK